MVIKRYRPPIMPQARPPSTKRTRPASSGLASTPSAPGVAGQPHHRHQARGSQVVGVALGVPLERVITDNGSAFPSHAFRTVCAALSIRQKLTRPYRLGCRAKETTS